MSNGVSQVSVRPRKEEVVDVGELIANRTRVPESACERDWGGRGQGNGL